MSSINDSNNTPHNTETNCNLVGGGGGTHTQTHNLNLNNNMFYPPSNNLPNPNFFLTNNRNIGNANTSLSMAVAANTNTNPFSLHPVGVNATNAHYAISANAAIPSFDMAALLTNAMVQQQMMAGQIALNSTYGAQNTASAGAGNTTTTTTTNTQNQNVNINSVPTSAEQDITTSHDNDIPRAVSNEMDGNSVHGDCQPTTEEGNIDIGGEVENSLDGGDVGSDMNSLDSARFYMGLKLTIEEYDNTAVAYANQMGYDIRREKSKSKAKNPEYNNIQYKYICSRGRKAPPKKEKESSRPTRVSLRVDCGYYSKANHPMKEDRSGRDMSVVVIVGLCLEHTNGCKGRDELINKAIRQRRGRKYTDVQLTHLRKEVKAGRYKTDDVKSWLVDQGMTDATLEEATNLRYRLLKDRPIKGWYAEDGDDSATLGAMQDYLFNEDLAREITAGGQQSVDNLRVTHSGLRQQVRGYDFRLTTDTEKRFSGTSWQTGRMRTRLRRNGVFIFLDDSRSGINTSGFCFWNIVVVDGDGKVHTVMGAMTMSASIEAVRWMLWSMVDMCPEAVDIVKGTMSDLGESSYPILTRWHVRCSYLMIFLTYNNNSFVES